MIRIAASLLALATLGTAEDFWLDEDLPFVDIRLGYGFVPKTDAYDVEGTVYPQFGGGTFAYTDSVDSNRANELSYSIVGGSISPVGALFGGEIVYAWDSQTLEERTINGAPQALPNDSSSLQYRTFGGNLLLGVGVAISSNVHLEALGVAGLGAFDVDFADGPGGDRNDGGGWYWNAGVRGGAYLTFRRFVIGAVIQWLHQDYSAETGWLDVETSVEGTTSGIGGRLEIGYHIQ